jgi:uncharacterized protein (DUF433 family)
MDTVTIRLPRTLYDMVVEQAARRSQPPDHLIEEILTEQLMPRHPYVEILQSRSGPRAAIKGTRIGIDVIAGYTQAGYTPREIVENILPHLTLAQVYDALSYYEDHRAAIDESLRLNTPEAWRERLRQRLGDAAGQLVGSQ